MIPISKAFTIIDREVKSLGSEKVELSNSVDRILHENIIADTDLPPFDRSQMDGFAVIAAETLDAPVKLEIIGESAAGRGWHRTVKPGQAVRIMTGAPVPKGADAVQKVELTRDQAGLVEILEPTDKGRYIVHKAAETKKGEVIFKTGDVVTENMIASLASFGYAKVKVGKQPRVAILGTGSEIVPVNKKPGRDQIRNSNSVMLECLCNKFGARSEVFPIIKDKISDLKSQISNAVKGSDILVITGGVSVGKYDHTKTALAEIGAKIFFDKVCLKPGKPTVFAKLGKTMVFGLPGNPVSAAVTFHLFVRRALLAVQGANEIEMRSSFAVLAADAKATKERDTYLPARLATNASGQLTTFPIKWHGSSDFIGFAHTDCLIHIPKGQAHQERAVVRVFILN